MKILIIDSGDVSTPIKLFQISDDISQVVDETTAEICHELVKFISTDEIANAINEIPKNVTAELMTYVASAIANTGKAVKTNDLFILQQLFIAHNIDQIKGKNINDIFHSQSKYKKLASSWIKQHLPKLKTGNPAPGY